MYWELDILPRLIPPPIYCNLEGSFVYKWVVFCDILADGKYIAHQLTYERVMVLQPDSWNLFKSGWVKLWVPSNVSGFLTSENDRF